MAAATSKLHQRSDAGSLIADHPFFHFSLFSFFSEPFSQPQRHHHAVPRPGPARSWVVCFA